jgi:hypothetical protein
MIPLLRRLAGDPTFFLAQLAQLVTAAITATSTLVAGGSTFEAIAAGIAVYGIHGLGAGQQARAAALDVHESWSAAVHPPEPEPVQTEVPTNVTPIS